MNIEQKQPRQFDWKVVVGFVAVAAGGAFAAGAWGAGEVPEIALGYGFVLWFVTAIGSAAYGHWMGWNG